MKRIFVLLLCVLLAVHVCACGNAEGGFETAENGVSEWRKNLFGRYFLPEAELADAFFQTMAGFVEHGDRDALRELFSTNTVASCGDIESLIVELVDFYQGEMISWERYGPMSHTAREGDAYYKEICASYDITTSADTYRLAFKLCIVDTEAPENLGLHAVYIIKAEDSDPQLAYWGDGEWKSGVVIEGTE